MEMEEIHDARDPRLADYVSLTDVELRRHVEAERGVFMVEGLLAIRALLQSSYTVRSVLVDPRAHARLAAELSGIGAPVYVVDGTVMAATVGFALHRGAVASANRPPELDAASLLETGNRLLVLEGVNDHENLGAIFRNAAAFGVDAVLLDPSCADPLYRRSVRVSLGNVLRVPFARLRAWPGSLARLHDAGWETVALTPSGDVDVDELVPRPPGRIALLLGAEGPGLTETVLAAADHRARIALVPGVDSLNVATAAAVALHVLRRFGDPVVTHTAGEK
jgi:tRNA G18 (ribose-2'-O)-methylase SpoU